MEEKKYTKKHLIIWIAVTVLLAGGAFSAGTKHGATTTRASLAQMRPGGQGFGAGAGRAGGAARFGSGAGLISGEVLSKDDSSMTVKMRDGSTRIILYSATTQVLKSAAGSASDVTVGTQVAAQGTQNADGSVTAQSIQIRPASSTGGVPSPRPQQQ